MKLRDVLKDVKEGFILTITIKTETLLKFLASIIKKL